MKKEILFLSIFWILLTGVLAFGQTEINKREAKLDFGHVLEASNIFVEPNVLSPGQPGILKMSLKNTANFSVLDIRTKLLFPDEISFFQDLSERKISELKPGESREIEYNIMALPSSEEGVYDATLVIDYLNKIGNERQDNNTFSIIVKAAPEIFAQIEKSEIYKGNDIGTVTIKFINNGIGNAKFLTVEALDSENYEIISSKVNYIGDLDSDDFESVDFRIKLNKEKTTDLLLKAGYRDSLNEQYSEEFNLPLEVRSAKELGIDTNGMTKIITILALIAIIIYFVYKKFWKKKRVIITTI